MQEAKQGVAIGRVVGLWRFPVKSMAPERLAEIDVSWHGFSGDRRWAFIRDEAVQSGPTEVRQEDRMGESGAEPRPHEQPPRHQRAHRGRAHR